MSVSFYDIANLGRILREHPEIDRPPHTFGDKYNETPSTHVMHPLIPHCFRNEILFVLRSSYRECCGTVLNVQGVSFLKSWRGTPIPPTERRVYRTVRREYTIVSYNNDNARLDYLETHGDMKAARKALRAWRRV